MKRIIIITTALLVAVSATAQADTNRIITEKRSANEKIKVSVGNDMVSYEDSPGNKVIRVGNRGLEILESLENPKVSFKRYESDEAETLFPQDDDKNTGNWKRNRRRFEGHWSGIEIGFNNFMTTDYSMILPEDDYFMTLNSGKSKVVNLNFAQINIGLTRRIGLVAGLGFNMNNYFFEANNSISKSTTGIIEPKYPEGGIVYEKSKLTTRYITLPILLEMQIPVNYNNHLNIAGGPIGAVKVGSHTKTVFYSDGKQKVKDHSDFSLNMLRYGFTGRIGYEMIQLYATYYVTPLFKSGKGPQLYPFEIGVSFTIND